MSDPAAVATHATHVAHEVHHEELGFWRKYVFSTDHKVIGIQYAVTGLLFLLFGFSLMMLMRWNLAYPGAALPLLGSLFGSAGAANFLSRTTAILAAVFFMSSLALTYFSAPSKGGGVTEGLTAPAGKTEIPAAPASSAPAPAKDSPAKSTEIPK